jgi:hypothetical protein
MDHSDSQVASFTPAPGLELLSHAAGGEVNLSTLPLPPVPNEPAEALSYSSRGRWLGRERRRECPASKEWDEEIARVEEAYYNFNLRDGIKALETKYDKDVNEARQQSVDITPLTRGFYFDVADLVDGLNSNFAQLADLVKSKSHTGRKSEPTPIRCEPYRSDSDRVGYTIYIIEDDGDVPDIKMQTQFGVYIPSKLLMAIESYWSVCNDKGRLVGIFNSLLSEPEAKAIKAKRRLKFGAIYAKDSRLNAKQERERKQEETETKLAEANQTIAALRAELVELRTQVYGASTTPPAGTGGNFNGGSVDAALTTRLQDLAL